MGDGGAAAVVLVGSTGSTKSLRRGTKDANCGPGAGITATAEAGRGGGAGENTRDCESAKSPRLTAPPTYHDVVPDVSRVAEGMNSSILVENYAPCFIDNLGDIPSHMRIPVIQTMHEPAFAMQSKCSENDGNIEVLDQMMEQSGINEEATRQFVLLVQGDLGVLDRIKSVVKSQSIERTDRESFEYLETVRGLFHILMACADAMWRVHIEPKGAGVSDAS